MTFVRLGYVAMSLKVPNSSPSQTMTIKNFSKIENENAAILKLERITRSNLHNTLRILRHNAAHDIQFYRMTSRLVPLATFEGLPDWDYMAAIVDSLEEIGKFVAEKEMRVDFHPDHFVLINSPKNEVLKMTVKTLILHKRLLEGMNIDPKHRCVLHIGGVYGDRVLALERFIQNWMLIPTSIQNMIILENDDKSFHFEDTLYLCEKLGIPLVFDYHHHLAHHENKHWEAQWDRIVNTWSPSPLPVKMHISSPKNEKQFRAHSDFVDVEMFMDFLNEIKGSVDQIDCMIEAKRKDEALFKLMKDLKQYDHIEINDGASFYIK
ncbi:UV DNA damage repair endonuclease UvsE [Pseudalkalibacillus salsuginis]|uniref:UV DNA damage repair endonuclease UvsE n=1 Tax=Pseudalkalibacillus salsuginis TaxID=2910972 RepID=UPI001F2CD92B|nr:UV DNA damage repair endonuclease UvsE [Pseudalkalibacillus salsuginis]MCF6410266.1 UV DNA damage repair endonuclease UvsE [Pseudalkalibacillus salsuginis]